MVAPLHQQCRSCGNWFVGSDALGNKPYDLCDFCASRALPRFLRRPAYSRRQKTRPLFGPKIEIRGLSRLDVQVAQSVMRAVWGEKIVDRITSEIRESFDNEGYFSPRYYAAWHGNKLVGFAGFVPSHILNGVFELNGICVLPQYQKKGVGRLLTEKRIERIRQLNGTLIILMTKERVFFDKLGFTAQNEFDDWYLMTMRLGKVDIK